MKQIFFLMAAFLWVLPLSAQEVTADAYQFKVDINKVANDKLQVELTVPKGVRVLKEAKYNFPKTIPGTYSIQDFGRFVTEFKAYNKKGKELKTKFIKSLTNNTWVILKPKKLYKISYTVEDTWDTEIDKQLSPDYIFEPAGTNIEEGKHFMFNNCGFFGYFDGLKFNNYFVEVDRPKDFFGSSALIRTGGDDDTDVFYAPNYMDLVDGPIMFNKPDVTNVKVGNATVLVSVYSPTGKVTSKFVAGEISPILQAQKAYLGGTLPVERYAFLIYLSEEGKTSSGSFGALEHSYSSVYFLPEIEPEQIAQTMRDVAAHEFFHIVTPLNIHSDEIGDFNYIDPKMSKHLWMYEGITEYSAGHVQVKHGLIPLEQYLGILGQKMVTAGRFKDDLPFTELSTGCLKEHKDQYQNVYEKGTLIGVCLDIKLRQLSKGKMGIQELMRELAKEYGISKSFEDDELFDKIVSLTYPEIADFFKTHVAGPESLPIKEALAQTGIKYFATKKVKDLSPLGGISQENIGFNGKNFFFHSTKGLDAFSTELLGFKEGDVLMKWNGKELTIKNVNEVLVGYMMSAKEGDDVSVTVEREGKEMKLATKLEKIEVEKEHVLEINEEATKEQLQLRKAWLGDYKMKEDFKEDEKTVDE